MKRLIITCQSWRGIHDLFIERLTSKAEWSSGQFAGLIVPGPATNLAIREVAS